MAEEFLLPLFHRSPPALSRLFHLLNLIHEMSDREDPVPVNHFYPARVFPVKIDQARFQMIRFHVPRLLISWVMKYPWNQ